MSQQYEVYIPIIKNAFAEELQRRFGFMKFIINHLATGMIQKCIERFSAGS